MLLSYFQVHMIIREIPISWPKAMGYLTEAHATLSGAGLSESVYIDCLFSKALTSSEILYMKQLIILIVFTVLGIFILLSVHFQIFQAKACKS